MSPFQRWLAAGALAAVSASASPVLAEPITFANFSQVGAGTPFHFSSGSGTAILSATDVPVYFQFADPSLLGGNDLPALLSLTATAALVPGNTGLLPGRNVNQVFDSLSFSFTLATPVDGASNLLSGTIDRTESGTAQLFGTSGTAAASLVGGTGDVNDPSADVLFTSDFLDFSATFQRDASFSFSGLTPALSYTRGNLSINDFAGDATGTFDEDFVPSFFAAQPPSDVPEPASVALLAVGLIGWLGVRYRAAAPSRSANASATAART